MSEPIGLASGLVALSTFALNSSVTLLDVICSFRDHPKRVRDLVDEVDALTGVLHPLKERVESTNSAELITLNRPLLRCGKACEDFRQALESCASQSGDTQATFRGWAKLKYMGDDVDGFRRLLAGYKSTISIALTDANLRVSSATAEALRSYVDLVESTNSDLRAHIDNVDEKMEALLQKAIPEVGPEAAELKTMQEERLSAQQCLGICDQLSRHINQIQRMGRCSGAQDGDPHLANGTEKMKEPLRSPVAEHDEHVQLRRSGAGIGGLAGEAGNLAVT
ncbi:hypothetical protein HIM_10813 [Hirsutella minnesotensis 3608]|uniref:Azaphilone pigments biosynthesis cluster protein L N-terminal domain-containing protein n=1 Tax=Hirsutella minnesotensis 3608 TaxID=1043627 RepID=A0A0F7ZJN8_9HYPO|nr:hypothetical protein HIM_10813 [Hirsutella minnesotensis 3608]